MDVFDGGNMKSLGLRILAVSFIIGSLLLGPTAAFAGGGALKPKAQERPEHFLMSG